jgi:hypothetical protein
MEIDMDDDDDAPPTRRAHKNSKRGKETELMEIDMDEVPRRKGSKASKAGAPIDLFGPKKRGKLNPTQKFAEKHGYCWDLCIVYKIHEADHHVTKYQKRYSLGRIAEALHVAGMQTSLFYSNQQDEIYCKIRAPVERIRTEADRIDLKMLIHEGRLQDKCEAGITEAEANEKGPRVYEKGEVVNAKFSMEETVYWPAKVSRVNKNGTFDIVYDRTPAGQDKKQGGVQPRLFEGYYRIEPFQLDPLGQRGCLQVQSINSILYTVLTGAYRPRSRGRS